MVVLVTGGAGYIGSHCVLALLEAGYEVAVFDSLELGHKETMNLLKEVGGERLVRFTRGDLLDRGSIVPAFSEGDVEAVVHFAAYSRVEESVRDPGRYYRNNVCGTLNLLDAMRDYGVGMMVFSSTAAVYGEPKYVPIDEDHSMDPINPYGRSKMMVERIMDDYSESYGLRSVRLRYFNVAGADGLSRIGEWHEPETHLIPNILRSAIEDGFTFRMFGEDYNTRDGTCIRDYVDVRDLADAHVLALRYLEKGGRTDAFNLGTKEGSTVREVYQTCRDVLGADIPLEVSTRRPGDPAALVADNDKARRVLGWNPRRTLEDSISSAYAWEYSRHGHFGNSDKSME